MNSILYSYNNTYNISNFLLENNNRLDYNKLYVRIVRRNNTTTSTSHVPSVTHEFQILIFMRV